jgi:hypothetical protein
MEPIDKPLPWGSSISAPPSSGDDRKDDLELKAAAEQYPTDLALAQE